MRTIEPSSVAGSGALPEWQRMPSRTCSVRFSPRPSRSSAIDDAQRLLPVVKGSAEALAQAAIQHVLADVTERRVSEVMPETDRLGEVLVQRERARDGARDARHLEGVSEPGAVVVALGRDEHLRLVLEPTEGLGVHDPVAVALERRPQAAVRLADGAPPRIGARRERGELAILARAHAQLERRGHAHRCAAGRRRRWAWCSSVSPIARSASRRARGEATGACASELASAAVMNS